jgi:hypothetical protein
MTAPFDPYHRWLGIRPEDQPADHYRLLGLSRHEDDVEVIRDAAERQIAHVRRYAVGDHAEDANRILNELGNAKACLIVGNTKRSYDASLKGTGVAPPHADYPADVHRIDRPSTRPTAPIPLGLIEPDVRVSAAAPNEVRPLQLAPQSKTRAIPAVPPPVRGRPKTVAQMQTLRQPKLSAVSSGRELVRQADAILKQIAGEGNELLHGFLRVCAIAGVMIVSTVSVVLAVSWATRVATESGQSLASSSKSLPQAVVTSGDESKSTVDIAPNASPERTDATATASGTFIPAVADSMESNEAERAVSSANDVASSPASESSAASPAGAAHLPRVFNNSIGMQLVLIPAGEFLMGSPTTERDRTDYEQQHQVHTTKPFYLAKTEVTQGQWQAVMGTTPWSGQTDVTDASEFPATYVSNVGRIKEALRRSSGNWQQHGVMRMPERRSAWSGLRSVPGLQQLYASRHNTLGHT